MESRFDPIITKELILQNISQEAIMKHYLGVHIGKGLFRSPLRNDKKPTCAFYKNKSGDLIFKDFGGYFYGNCFSVDIPIIKWKNSSNTRRFLASIRASMLSGK